MVIAHDIRSAHNVGSLLRTCEGLGVSRVVLSGYTPFPEVEGDKRMPHEARKLSAQISKTSLGAENTVSWNQSPDIDKTLAELRAEDFKIVALEQAKSSVKLPDFNVPKRVALILGSEVTGVDKKLLDQVDEIIEIPMFGKKESFNVVQAAAMALYHFRFYG